MGSEMGKPGLAKMEIAKYSLTTFGMILYHTQEIIGKALNQYWKLKAIDSINVTSNGQLPQDKFHEIIDKLITRITYKWVRNSMAYNGALKVESSSTPVNTNFVPRASVFSEVFTYAILAVVKTYCPGINSDSVSCGRSCYHEG